MMAPLNKDMSVVVPTTLTKPDYPALLQDLVVAVIEDVESPSTRLRNAVERAKQALARGVQ